MAGKRKRRRRREFQREIQCEPAQVASAGGGVIRPDVRLAANRLKHAPEIKPAPRKPAVRSDARALLRPSAVPAPAAPPPPVAGEAVAAAATSPSPPSNTSSNPAVRERAAVLRVWRHANFSLLVGGSVPHHITMWMQRVGIGWLAWEMTHSATWLGIIAAADLAPMIFLAPFAGAACDRFSMMTMMRISNFLVLMQAVALAVLTGLGLITIELLFLLSLFNGIVHPFVSASRHTIVPQLVPRSDFASAVALDSAIFQASRFIGPAAAALMMPFTGVNGTFIAHVIGMLAMLAALYLMRVEETAKHSHRRRSMLYDVADSMIYVHRHAGIFPVFVLLTVASILIRPVQDLLPGFAGSVFTSASGAAAGSAGVGATELAWLTSAMGAGAMISAGWIAVRGRVEGLTTVLLLGGLGLVVATVGFVATTSLWVGVAFAALSGFGLNVMSTCIQSLVQTAVSDEMRGRVMSLYILIFRGTPAIGAVFLGLLSDWVGLRITFAIAAALAFAAWLWVAPRQRQIASALELTGPAPAR